MTNEEFNGWRQRLGLTYAAAAEALGTSERSVYNYARNEEPHFIIPRYIELACCELERLHMTSATYTVFDLAGRRFVACGLALKAAKQLVLDTGYRAIADREVHKILPSMIVAD